MSRVSRPILILACTVAALVTFVVDLSLSLGVAGGIPYVIPVLLSVYAGSAPAAWILAGTCIGLTGLGVVLSPVDGGVSWIVALNRALTVLAIALSALIGLGYRRSWERTERARHAANELRGLLPICASCKSIRDDQGYWQRVESYIEARSTAEFSHGICPSCAVALYGELAEDPAPTQKSMP